MSVKFSCGPRGPLAIKRAQMPAWFVRLDGMTRAAAPPRTIPRASTFVMLVGALKFAAARQVTLPQSHVEFCQIAPTAPITCQGWILLNSSANAAK